MTTRTHKYGKHTCKAYKKTAGKGYEVGFTYGGHQVFVGNFIHADEANTWWTKMNTEIRRFGTKYRAASHAPSMWTRKFMSNYMYKCYYTYLDGKITKYNKNFTKAVKKRYSPLYEPP